MIGNNEYQRIANKNLLNYLFELLFNHDYYWSSGKCRKFWQNAKYTEGNIVKQI